MRRTEQPETRSSHQGGISSHSRSDGEVGPRGLAQFSSSEMQHRESSLSRPRAGRSGGRPATTYSKYCTPQDSPQHQLGLYRLTSPGPWKGESFISAAEDWNLALCFLVTGTLFMRTRQPTYEKKQELEIS